MTCYADRLADAMGAGLDSDAAREHADSSRPLPDEKAEARREYLAELDADIRRDNEP